MKKSLKLSLLLLLCACLLIGAAIPSFAVEFVAAAESPSLNLPAKSAILIEAETGKVLYESNPDERLHPASVTKVMTLLLVMEAIASGQITLGDMVSVSPNAASMGGSQVYLEPGEQMSVEDLLKCVIIASANDAAVALAEYIGGSEESFVNLMNDRAAALGMTNTHFENTNGLDDTTTNHLTTARDIAIMSAALLAYDTITKYSTIWMDSIRDGAFGLTNTNRLVRFYPGCTGLKTGSTSKAGFCISASAKRDGLHLIAVIMGSSTRDERNNAAQKLLDWGFANYSFAHYGEQPLTPMYVKSGREDYLPLQAKEFDAVVGRGASGKIKQTTELPETLSAPIKKGDTVGYTVYSINDSELGRSPIVATRDIKKATVWSTFARLLGEWFNI